MTIEELRAALAAIKAQQDARTPGTIAGASDPEEQHMEADELLIEFIGDDEVTKIFRSLTLWYG